MNRNKYMLAGVTLVLMAATAAVLFHLKTYQRLGEPGVKTRPLAGSKNLEILMPETVSGCTSEILTNVEASLSVLPPDTSYRCRLYQTEDKFQMQITTVLMGADRTSIHNPEICLTGQGWKIDDNQTKVEPVPISRPFPYQLPVNQLISAREFKDDAGNARLYHGIFLYWFVDPDHYTPSKWKWRMWLMPHDLLARGIMDRWAYISCFTPCLPGQEQATRDRMEKMIADIVPEFQLVPRPTR